MELSVLGNGRYSTLNVHTEIEEYPYLVVVLITYCKFRFTNTNTVMIYYHISPTCTRQGLIPHSYPR